MVMKWCDMKWCEQVKVAVGMDVHMRALIFKHDGSVELWFTGLPGIDVCPEWLQEITRRMDMSQVPYSRIEAEDRSDSDGEYYHLCAVIIWPKEA